MQQWKSASLSVDGGSSLSALSRQSSAFNSSPVLTDAGKARHDASMLEPSGLS
jgi:hypothetical protein